MILLQLSSGKGPAECGRAVFLAFTQIEKEAQSQGITINLLQQLNYSESRSIKSILMEVKSSNPKEVQEFVNRWKGVMLWNSQSPFRPKHKRKNWFFSAQVYEIDQQKLNHQIEFNTCRSSGAGGQHVNKTDSAVQATHISSGISVRVESERSQHANKRLAIALIYQRLDEQQQQNASEQHKTQWQQHMELQRGNPDRVFKGEKFVADT
ncbi:peptide chain release factor H [Neptuniibacter sp. SY11_33]|uniref:peptide chain release factor H n=1 Tax=Neptuniibacter sp. SY11_33 TaxID=3398215 RepID=UPI0039F5F104